MEAKGRPLKIGDRVGVVATASPTDPVRLNRGVAALSALGFTPVVPLDPSADYGVHRFGFASATIPDRLSAFSALIGDSSVSAIISARGAYGTAELLEGFPFDLLRNNPKPCAGFSDFTAFLNAAVALTGVPMVHGSSVSGQFAEIDQREDSSESARELIKVLSDPAYRVQFDGDILLEGAGEGVAVGGNLTVLTTLLGTRFAPRWNGAVLFLEEIKEAPFRVHRMLVHFLQAGVFDGLKGLVFGRFSDCVSAHGPTVDDAISQFLRDHLDGAPFPILRNAPFGHGGLNRPVPLGCRVRLSGSRCEFLESPVM